MSQPRFVPALLLWRHAGLRLAALFFAHAVGVGIFFGWGKSSDAQMPEDVRFFRIAAGPIGEGVFSLAGLLAGAFSSPPGGRSCDKGGSCGIPGMIAVAQGVTDSASALESLQNGQVDAAIATLDITLAKTTGKAIGETTPVRQFHTLATLFTRNLHILVREETDYRTPLELHGKRVLLAGDSRRLQLLARALIDNALRPTSAEPLDALTELAEGNADAVLMLEPASAPLLVEMTKTLPLRLLPVDATRLPASLSMYRPTHLPAGLYSGIGATATVGLPVQLLVNDSMSADLAQRLTSVLWHNATAKSLTDGPPESRAMRLDQALMGARIPLHPGAAAYYQEIGMLPPSSAVERIPIP